MRWVLAAGFLLAGMKSMAAQTSTSASTATPEVRTVGGQVVNGLTGAPVPRALVSVGLRSALTDAQGHFEFPQFTETRAAARVMKPGFTGSLDPNGQNAFQQISNLDAPILLKLYPDGVIHGTITDQDGLPIGRVPVSLMKATYDLHGLRETQAGFSMTDSHGRYRFREPPARYRVVLRYVPRLPEGGEAALPAQFPDGSPRVDAGYVPLASAEERVVDLHPIVSPTHLVTLHTDAEDGRRGLQLTAVTSAGDVFQLGAAPGPEPGVYRLSLPPGTYQLHATINDQDQMLEGSGRVTVASRDVPDVPLHLSPAASLPIEMTFVASATTANQVPVPQQLSPQNLGLTLHPVSDQMEGQINDLQPFPKGDGRFEFRVPAGRYRLQQNFAFYQITSATCGGVNALTEEIAIAPGSAGSVLRVTATNEMAQVSGTIVPTPDATAVASGISPGWVYVIPQFPTLAPVMPIRIASSGSWSTRAYPGTYTIVALHDSIQADLSDPVVAAKYGRLGKSVEVNDAGTGSVELTLATEPETAP